MGFRLCGNLRMGGQCPVSHAGPRSPAKTFVVGRAALLRPEWGQAGSLPSLGKLALFPKALGWLQPWDSGRNARREEAYSDERRPLSLAPPLPCLPGEQMAALKHQRCRRASWPSRQSFRKELAALTSGHWYPGARHFQGSRKSPLSLCVCLHSTLSPDRSS